MAEKFPVQFKEEMLRTSESETEILLGNKQLLGIFFVVVILLGVAFGGGYKLGQGSSKKTAATATADQTASDATGTGGETHSVPPSGSDSAAGPAEQPDGEPVRQTETHAIQAPPSGEDEPPLGSAHRKKAVKVPVSEPEPISPLASAASGFTPETGQTFLQVAAVGRDEAAAIADVLHKKGFRAHAVPKPGNAKIYRVLIGPTRDAGDLSTTRDALRKTGFREVIVQRY